MTSVAAAMLAITGLSPALGESSGRPGQVLADVARCRTITDRDARLACYDKAAAALDAAASGKKIVVMDREDVAETRRRMFGIKLPTSPVFADVPEPDSISTTLTSATTDASGTLIFRLADGSIWRQTDQNSIPGKLNAGEKVTVSKAALGSFRLTVARRPGIKVRRVE